MKNRIVSAVMSMVVLSFLVVGVLPQLSMASDANTVNQNKAVSTENASAQPQQEDQFLQKIVQLIVLTLVVLAIIGILLGVTNKAIFYADGKDVIKSFIPFAAPFALGILLAILGSILELGKWYQSVMPAIIILTAFVCIIYVFNESLKYNQGNKFFALTVTLGKMALSFMCIFMFNQLTSWDKNKSAGENWSRQASAALWLAVIAGLMKILVNGEKVLERNAVTSRA